jgi:hypothetical protein
MVPSGILGPPDSGVTGRKISRYLWWLRPGGRWRLLRKDVTKVDCLALMPSLYSQNIVRLAY